jgi:hypothetical protein
MPEPASEMIAEALCGLYPESCAIQSAPANPENTNKAAERNRYFVKFIVFLIIISVELLWKDCRNKDYSSYLCKYPRVRRMRRFPPDTDGHNKTQYTAEIKRFAKCFMNIRARD